MMHRIDRHMPGRTSLVVLILLALTVFTAAPAAATGMLRLSAAMPELLPGALFAPASDCRKCHDNLTDSLGADVSFIELWRTTMMRMSFIDPLWKAKVYSETLRMPAASPLTAVAIEKKCVRCHAPMASEQAAQDGSPIRLFDDGFSSTGNIYHDLAMEGVSCTLCHQITSGPVVGDPFSGHFEISDRRVGWGPFSPSYTSIMVKNSGYLPEQSAHVRDSEYCARCHDLHTDYVDIDGNIVTQIPFPEQTPYLEWLASNFPAENKQCQYCHTTPAASTKITNTPFRSPSRDGVRRHTFYTENTMMLSIIESMAQNPALGLPSDLQDLGDAIDSGQEYLGEAASIDIENMSLNQNTLSVVVKVTNLAGHKLPTSIPVRRVFIHFAVYTRSGDLVFSSGDVDEEGRIIGADSDFTPYAYEPHYDQITSPQQVQVYEGIMGTVEETVTYTLLRASHFKKDNRILPLGFVKNDPDNDLIKPAGLAYSDDNFKGGEDRITYQVPIDSGSGSRFLVVAELKDQTLAYPFIADLGVNASGETNPIDLFLDEYQHHKVHFEIIASDSQEFRR